MIISSVSDGVNSLSVITWRYSGGTKTAMDAHVERAKKMNEINHRCLNIHLNAMKTVQDNTFLCTRENMNQDQ